MANYNTKKIVYIFLVQKNIKIDNSQTKPNANRGPKTVRKSVHRILGLVFRSCQIIHSYTYTNQ